jgi:hypothetical protein
VIEVGVEVAVLLLVLHPGAASHAEERLGRFIELAECV